MQDRCLWSVRSLFNTSVAKEDGVEHELAVDFHDLRVCVQLMGIMFHIREFRV